MQITLATTSVLSDLDTSGSLSGELSVADNGITALHVTPERSRTAATTRGACT